MVAGDWSRLELTFEERFFGAELRAGLLGFRTADFVFLVLAINLKKRLEWGAEKTEA